MKKPVWIFGLLFSGAASLPLAAQPMAGMEAQQTSHRGTGKVVSVDCAKSRIKLAHEPIKSLGWAAMVMVFSVTKAPLLDGLKEGDAVQFELRQPKPGEWVIVKIKRKQ